MTTLRGRVNSLSTILSDLGPCYVKFTVYACSVHRSKKVNGSNNWASITTRIVLISNVQVYIFFVYTTTAYLRILALESTQKSIRELAFASEPGQKSYCVNIFDGIITSFWSRVRLETNDRVPLMNTFQSSVT